VSVEPGKNQEVVPASGTWVALSRPMPCWGQPDIFTFVEVPDEKALSETVLTTIQSISGVRARETHVVSTV
jgi:hypothetical protein